MSNRSRAFSFTINNWTESQLVNCLNILDEAVYSIIGFEVAPTTGTQHIQGYVYFKNARGIKAIRKALQCHVEISRGTAEQNRTYCMKEGDYNEFGIMPKQGKRNDLVAFKDAIIDGESERVLIDEYTECFAKYDRFWQRCRNIVLKEKAETMEAPEVIVLIGEPGVGKTRLIYDTEDTDNIYKLEVGDGSTGSVFWNGYDGEEIILIDDFHNNLKLDYMLRLLDRYPMRLNTKGSYTWKCAKKIYITSNIDVNYWYPNCADIHKRALMRRITEIKYLQSAPVESIQHTPECVSHTEPFAYPELLEDCKTIYCSMQQSLDSP